eukprot:TRINITY_DN2653_c0_g1_i2.p1 TRINITY_DN2653_c0_g1~~TRINITY_DN2653_c0_g1_i2.p1  ORF type:complete len:693 (+),score=192.23 TRINITY_DN2653_c0_g1_i2:40-2118(+)
MWKKPLGKYQTQPVKNKDVKGLKKLIGEGVIEGKEDVTLWKLDSRLHVYAWGGAPMYIDTSGKLQGRLVPTVFALWRLPDLLPPLYVNAEVSPYILKGADLMWPGVYSPAFSPVVKGQLVAVTAVGNPMPFAVGTITVDTKMKLEKGKAVEILHYFNDFLAQEGKVPTPGGFSCERITAVQLPSEEAETPPTSLPEANSEEDEELYHEVENVLLADVLDDCSDDEIPEEGNADESEEDEGEKKGKRHARMEALKAKKEGKKGGKKGDKKKDEEETTLTPDEMDELIHLCFVGGMSRLTKAELPMLVSSFYSQYMLPSRPEGSNVVLKKSSYKKIGNLISLMSKEGVMRIAQKSAGVDEIREINKRASFYLELSKSVGTPSNTMASAPSASVEEGAINPEVMPPGKVTKVEVLHSVKGDSTMLKTVFKGSKEPRTAKEINTCLIDYIEEGNISTRTGVKGGKGQMPDPWVKVNPELGKLWSANAMVERTVVFRKEKLADSLGFKTNTQLSIVSMDAGGLAKSLGLQTGDTVKEIDGTKVKSIDEMGKQLAALKEVKVIEVTIRTKDRCPEEAKLSDIQNRILKQTVPAYSVHHEGGKVVTGRGSVPQIALIIKRRGGNKTLTYVHSLDKFSFDIPATAQELKIFLAGSVTVMPPTPPYSSTILLQGRQIKKLAAFFQSYKIPKEFIVVKDLKK